MNFKEIRLVGFKSFADKTSVKFDDGVTCIVGPNGCGKSNVSDAVRWVLGEQSAKSMRGTAMADVIFNGADTRRALSYCEVTLVFDNSTHMFDIEYEEVAMTRRLYRSGESEYLLNMQPCRLKDIVTLLHGVGIGKEGYSIIGQGKVDQIMSAKPEDRRAIFEEATGVMKFKSQKGEIERKLENAQDNLTVFLQRLDEKEHQLRPLEKQAETAIKYRELSEKLRYEEVNSYLLRYDGFASETQAYRAEIDKAEKGLKEIGEHIEATEKQGAADREAAENADEQLRSVNEKLRLFEVGMEHKTGEAKVIGERIQSQKRQLSAANEEVQYSLTRIGEIEESVEKSIKMRESGQKRAEKIVTECEALAKQVAEANARVVAYERVFDEKRASELSSVENLADIRAKAGSLSARRDAASERIAEVEQAIKKARAQQTEYARQIEECRKQFADCEKFLDEKPQREKEMADEIASLGRSRQKVTEELIDCNTSIANFENNLEFYKGLKNRFDGYRDSVRALQIKAQKDPALGAKIKGAIADIVSTEKRYEVAIETAFGAAMQNLVTANEDDARDLIQYLKQTGGGIVTFLPVSAMRARYNSREIERALSEEGALGLAEELVTYDEYYSNIIRNLLGNTLICDDIRNATRIAKRYPRAFKIVTLDGDTIATSGAMTGGSHRKESGNLLASARNIKECEDAIERKKAIAEKLKKALESCENELKETGKQRDAFRIRAQEEAANFAAIGQRIAALETLEGEAKHNVEEYSALLDRLTATVNSFESEALTAAETEDALNRIRSEAAEDAAKQQAESEKLKAERDELTRRLQELRVEQAAIDSSRAAEEASVQRLQNEKNALLQRVDEAHKNIARLNQLIEQLKHDEECAALTQEEQHTVAVLRSRLKEIEQEKQAVNARLAALDGEKRELITRQMTLTDKKHEGEMNISKAEAYLENMQQRIMEMYSLDYEGAQALRDPEYDDEQSYSRINGLKRSIGSLGQINHNAEEDYANLLAEYTEMTAQKEDLEKGILDLTSVLTQLKDEIKDKFDKGFNEINNNFIQIFKELFGGGKANMELDYTDCDDPLNAGVEIVACPPGKKLTKISLLSGGERAFTAIAILFAILKSRPMPFCILDEIEAELDEANVDRFAKYLKKFSKETQFIVITHRKPTMNQADTLFGVTMEEKGVSKIVSVKLSEVESRLGGDTVM